VALPLSARATVLPLPGLHLLLLRETAKSEAPSVRALLVLLVQANSETPLAILRVLREKRLVQARQVVLEEKDPEFVLQPANQRLVLLLVAQVRPRDLFLHSAKLQERQRQQEKDFPVPLARARQYSRDPGPCAFSRGTPAVRKCNRAVRCGGSPIFVRCRPRRNRRALARCDNKCSRSQRKRARHARPIPIAAEDRCRCLPRPIADSDVRSASLE
jgi:hypothetical protein